MPAATAPADTESLAAALIERGVTPAIARSTAANHPAEAIQRQLAVFDWMRSQPGSRLPRNPPGFLVSAIRGAYALPHEFLSHEMETQARQQAEEGRRKQRARREIQAARREQSEQAHAEATKAAWESLSAAEQERIRAEAFRDASRFQRQLMERGGPAGTAATQAALDARLRKLLNAKTLPLPNRVQCE